ncbi:MAG TPA: type II secretion system protein N [Steroidobacteraceae bacterium]|nr:type II secretion system protein N [Steroidobacteraceae bacterium]
MKRGIWITLLAVVAFAAILIARLPVRWVSGLIPKNVTCAELAGTVWDGSCSGLVAQNVRLDGVSWRLRPLALFARKLAGHVELTRGANYVRGDIEAKSGGALIAHNLQADMPLDPSLIPQLPRDLSGTVRANLQSLQIEDGAITAVQGLVEAHDLVQMSAGQRMALGNYALTFPPADAGKEPVGRLQSTSGPLKVEGTLRLTREPGFVLEGLVAAGPEASPQLVKELSYLGSPDAQGRRPFSVAATF